MELLQSCTKPLINTIYVSVAQMCVGHSSSYLQIIIIIEIREILAYFIRNFLTDPFLFMSATKFS